MNCSITDDKSENESSSKAREAEIKKSVKNCHEISCNHIGRRITLQQRINISQYILCVSVFYFDYFVKRRFAHKLVHMSVSLARCICT